MMKIVPFKGIRPAKDKVHLVASRSVDSYTSSELKLRLAENPYTFLHIIRPEFGEIKKTIPGSPENLLKIRAMYERYLKEGIFINDTKESFYVYQQQKGEDTFTGIIGCCSIDNYFSGKIKIHEQTITKREQKLKGYLDVCNFNAEPVLFSYPDDDTINSITEEILQTEPVYDFTTTDKIRHTLWIVNDEIQVQHISERFGQIPNIYIADGHHRSASSALLGKERRDRLKNPTGEESFNYYMGAFFSKKQLKIYDYNRVVKDLNGLSNDEFLNRINEKFEINEIGTSIYKASQLHNFSMYLEGKWYSLIAKEGTYHYNDPVGSLDASILTEHILSPILDIHDLRTDKRIGFVNGTKGMQELKNQVDSGKMKVAFGLYPVSMQQLKLIADTNNIMPPKSTWVEPKLRSGLVIYSLDY